ncbi:Sporulation related domain-containing protein [Thiothrix caldifontis]|uniref:Sporulation related domain-containing protein n=1 Tax=Thiothrix caldifontis TaxID=525918 RepID=A0A1H4CQ97_9GAMM|nr:SPOR domain-containing protein [Thiothrix caldifontis]SEA62575.1 Sporulation related domain-containing protein [Thiothrix caldifontis]
MNNQMKMSAVALTLAALMAGCAPVPGTAPQAGATTGGDYGANSYGTTTTASTDYGYNTGTTPAATNTTPNNSSYYDYGAGSSTGSSAYGSTTTGSTSGSYYDYSAPSSSTSGSYSGSYSNTAGGSYAVQVVASPNSGTAEAMRSQMQSMGFNAVVDQVGGYYKVRVPFSSESEAKANLGRIRSSVPDAFYTVR